MTGILGALPLLWLILDYAMDKRLQPLALQFEDLGVLEKLSTFIWLSFLFMFFFHLLAAGTLLIQMRYLLKIQPLGILAIAVGVISFLGVFSDWAVPGDIGKEYKMGWDTAGEWRILNIILGIHFVFVLLVTGLSAGMLRWLKLSPDDPKMPAKDEIVFVVSQYVGRNVKVSVYHWFPFTLFVILFLFSLFTLLNYRRS
jgi:hypothetical protein